MIYNDVLEANMACSGEATIAPLKPLLLPYGHLHLVQVVSTSEIYCS
jgi:hypothetical protein